MPEEVFETPQTVEPKPTNWPKIVLATVLGFGLLVGASYAGYWHGTESARLKSQISKPQLEAEKPTTIPVEDQTRDWKTFTDRDGRVLVKAKEGWYDPSLEILEKLPTETLQDWLEKRDDLERQDPLCQSCFKVFSERETTTAGRTAIVREVASHPGGRGLRGYISLDADEVVYIMTCCGDPDIALPKERYEQFDQILSTFKFLD